MSVIRKLVFKTHLNMFLKDQTDSYLKKYNITKCKECYNTGLKVFKNINGDFNWSMSEECKKCNGVGFCGVTNDILFKIDDVTYLCNACYGHGCINCNSGYIDWIKYAMKG